ncbi:AAA family ATPase [Enterobacter cloacae]|uniref:AAA family ATPase n=1 Tax=Enterobacter TaxID=547 RepID=UPI0021D3AADF|nr:AAA family ATPase [Enterobacter cloacae]MCU6202436.1 AAA family ATPase [Enterobacter cloacae]
MQQLYRIESLTLIGVGVFEHTHIDFPKITDEARNAKKAEIHIFTGPNGCGKSTILYALAGILNPQPGGDALVKKRYHGTDSFIRFSFSGEEGLIGIKAPLQPERYTPIYSNDSYYSSIENGTSSKLFRNRPYLNIHEQMSSSSFDFAGFAYSGTRDQVTSFDVGAIQEIKASPFDNSLSFSNTVRPKLLAQWIANSITQAVLARNEGSEAEAQEYDRALTQISAFIKNVCDIETTFRLKRKPLAVAISVEGQDIAFDTLPEGLKSMITWVVDLALRLESIPWKNSREIFAQPIILFLDEVDIHLHPKWQRRILPAIQKLLPNAQIFVSTHSPFVVGSVEDAYVYRLPEPHRNECRDASIAENIEAIDSKAGKSYQLILSDVFGIDEEFDVETEEQLTKFKALIRQHLLTEQYGEAINGLAKRLSDKGEELSEIVSLELRQMQRLMSKKQG